MAQLSIIVPTLDEETEIADALDALAPLRRRGVEVIVADGGSRDRTVEIARPLADQLIAAPRGRAAQMNAGAKAVRGDTLMFLHADTRLPADADRLVAYAMQGERVWGRFDVRITGRHLLLPLVAALMNIRSQITGIATGDQAIFVKRSAFNEIGGYPDVPLMEDIALSRRLKRVSRPICLSARVTTSGRRWDERGFIRTVALMWWLRLAYFCGAHPTALARRYGYTPREG
jgi:rSAM/selenodomain-associated transferase 2